MLAAIQGLPNKELSAFGFLTSPASLSMHGMAFKQALHGGSLRDVIGFISS